MKLAVVISTTEVDYSAPVALLEGSFVERLQKAASLGYDGVELLVVRPSDADTSTLCEQVAEAGLETVAVGTGAITLNDRLTLLSPDTTTRRRAAVRLREVIDFSAAIGSPLVTIGGFRGHYQEVDGKTRLELLTEILRHASEEAAEKGVRLVVEPLNRYETDVINNVQEGLDLIDRVGQRSLGLLLDTFHMNIEEASLPKAFRLAGEHGRLWHVHLGDSNRLAPGLGHIDFSEISRTLCEIGYDSYLSAELLPRPNPDEAASLMLRHMRQFVPTGVDSGRRKSDP